MPRQKLTEKEKAERRALAAAKKEAEAEAAERLRKKKTIKDEIIAIVILAIGVFLVLSLFTSSTGKIGEGVKNALVFVFGFSANILPFFFILFSILVFAKRTALLTWRTLLCSAVFYVLLTTIIAHYKQDGVVGKFLGELIVNGIGVPGLWIVCIIGMIITLVLLLDTPLSELLDNLRLKAKARKDGLEEQIQIKMEEHRKAEEEKERLAQEKFAAEQAKIKEELAAQKAKENMAQFYEELDHEIAQNDFESFTDNPVPKEEYSQNQKNILGYMNDDELFGSSSQSSGKGLEPAAPKKVSVEDVAKVENAVVEDINKAMKKTAKYSFPPIDLLKKGPSSKNSSGESLSDMSELLENTLESFGVQAKVVDVTKGPAVTRFEVQPAPGVKVSKIAGLHNDLALNLRAKSLRIEAPIPGKAAVGIEVSNENISTVSLREIIDSKVYKQTKSKVAVAVGKSIAGDPIICNIKDMPHLLIAGSTGSGKSVCINSMLLSLLYKSTPDEVKMILIDPKIVELSVYNGIPHLLIPVVTEPAKASAALGWAVTEMNDRYNKFAEESVRDLESYNDYVRANGEPEKVMPQIVIVIDELHDLMLSAKNTVEDNISRLAAKARAAGMHLIVATQRPSVDVITGVIKNNIPSRIAFAVGNQMDSRTILDEGGAEHLLGKGDMLYAPQGSSKPLRVQGCFVSDTEVKAVIDYVKTSNSDNTYNEEVIQALAKSVPAANTESDDEDDELLRESIQCVVKAGECSVSMLQRRFRIGYNHAARLVEIMEERGIVGPSDGARKRKVNMSMDEFLAMDYASNDIPEEID